MRIDADSPFALSCLGFLGGAAVGGFGAYVLKPIFNSMSPIGVALTCGLTTAIAIGVLFSDLEIGGKFVGLMAAYPVALISCNLMRLNVRVLDPMVSVFVGGVILTPMAAIAFGCSVIFSSLN